VGHVLETEKSVARVGVGHGGGRRAAAFGAVVVSIALACASASARNTGPRRAAQPTRTLLVLGDSLSAGYGLPRGTSWVDLLRRRLARRDPDVRVVNASVSGETSAEGRARLPGLLKRWHPFLVVLELGGNDGLRALPPAALEANLDAMIARSRKAGACVLLLGVRLPPNYGSLYERAFAAAFRRAARANRIPWIPFFLAGVATHRPDMQADGLHPNARAQPLILARIWKSLARLLQPGTPCR
jgi:acyl-CoA thioesterase-1